MTQLPMFIASTGKQPPKRARRAPQKPRTIEERCAAFDREHPEVYAELRFMAIMRRRAGWSRLGIAQLVEVARWNLETGARDTAGYKINNNYRAVWARRLMAEHPELAGIFKVRDRRTA